MAERVTWGPGKEARFREWFFYELHTALSQRLPLEAKWLDRLAAYSAVSETGFREFPWPGASGETIPSIATDVDQLYAKFLQTLHAAPNLWSVSALNERWVKVAKPMQDFLTLIDSNLLRMYNVNKRVVLETCKLGTGIYKVGWSYEQRKIRAYDPLSGKPVAALKVRSVPYVDHVRLSDFVIPAYAYAVDPDAQGGAPWVAERIRVSPDRLRMMAKATAPDLPNLKQEDLDRILRYEEPSQTNYDIHVQKTDHSRRFANEQPIEKPIANEVHVAGGVSAPLVRQIELWEVHVRYPAISDDTYDDLVVLWHHPTRTVIRTTLLDLAHGQRPYEVIRYFPSEGFYGIGVAEQKEVFQRVISNLVNYAVDNTLLSNAVMMGAKAGANILPGEPIYPGKLWITDGDPRAELFPIVMGQPNSNLQSLIGLFQTYGERRTGVSDIQLGSINELPGRTPATTMVSLLQEGNRRPDLTIKDMRYEGLSRVGLRLVQLFQQYLTKPVNVGQDRMLQVMVESLGMPEGQELAQKMTMPLDSAELGLGVTLSATSGSSNKEVDRQNILALLQLAAQVAPQIMQFTQAAVQFQGTPVGQVALGAANGITELYRRALEQYDIRDPESIVPAMAPSDPQAMAPPPQAGIPGMDGMLGGGMPLGAEPPGAPGMGALPTDAGAYGLASGVPAALGAA